MRTIKKILCLTTLIIGVLFGIAGFIVPPTGIIDGSVLILIAQLLTYSSAVLGLDLKFGNQQNM